MIFPLNNQRVLRICQVRPGAVVASRLSEDRGASVLLLEAGPRQEAMTAVPAACGACLFSEIGGGFFFLDDEDR